MAQQLANRVFNYLTLRTFIGGIAILLPFIVLLTANIVHPGVDTPTSISVTYYLGARDFFVGSLFIVSAFLFSYNGFYDPANPKSQSVQSILSKIAGTCAAIVGLFPTSCSEKWICTVTNQAVCQCKPFIEFLPVGTIHTTAAILLFIILAIFCLHYFQIGTKKPRRKKRP